MLICPHCQSANPPGHKFCQSCGKSLQAADTVEEHSTGAHPAAEPDIQQANTYIPLQVTLLSSNSGDEPLSTPTLRSGAYVEGEDQPAGNGQRYQIVTVLNEQTALVQDTKPEARSPLQAALSTQLSTAEPSLEQLQAIPQLPASVYPYCLLAGSAPRVYDAWQQGKTTAVVTRVETPPLSSLLQSFAIAADALNHVYWLYMLTDLWIALKDIPQWRSTLLLADHLGIDSEHSVQVHRFANPSDAPPDFADLKAFLRSLLAQPNRVTTPPDPQIRQIILTLSSATTLHQLRSELSEIGEFLLSTTKAITPVPTHTSTPVSNPASVPIMVDKTTPTDTTLKSFTKGEQAIASAEKPTETEEIELLGDPSDSGESTMVLPMKLVAIEEAGRTDVGRQRDHNEDCFFIRSSTQKHADNSGQTTQAHSLYVLCDGMGGHAGGEVASRLAAETLSSYFAEHWPHPLPGQPISPLPSETVIATAVRLANQAIFEVNEKEERAGHERMGTTLVMALIQGAEAAVAHVGDSRLYQHARRTGLKQVTTDHEVGQREIQRGVPHDIAYARPDAYQLTQALGPRGDGDLSPSVSYLTFSEDTLLLLCSDGLSDNNLVEDYLESHIDPLLRGAKDMDRGVDELMTLANEVNGHDNISVIAIRLRVSPDMTKMRTPMPNRGLTIIQ